MQSTKLHKTCKVWKCESVKVWRIKTVRVWSSQHQPVSVSNCSTCASSTFWNLFDTSLKFDLKCWTFRRIRCQHRPYLSSVDSSKISHVLSDILQLSPWKVGYMNSWSEMSPQFWRISISLPLPLTLQRHLMFSLTYYGPLLFWKVGGQAGSNSLIFPWLPVITKIGLKTSQ